MNTQTRFQSTDVCGNDLRSLIYHGHSLIARVLQLSNEIPPCFRYDYNLQKHSIASLEGSEKKSKLAYMWNKITAKKSEVKILRRQALSYQNLLRGDDENDRGRHQNATSSAYDKHNLHHSDGIATGTGKQNISDARYKSILIDFSYLGDPERYDSHLHVFRGEETDEERRKLMIQQEHLEREFISEFEEMLAKFHEIFSDILTYYHDISHFSKRLQQGHYVQYSMQSLLQHEEGRQYLCEMFYLYGTILVLLDMYIPGTIRERFIIANHRYRSNEHNSNALRTSEEANFEQLCKLFQRTDDELTTNNLKGASPLVSEHYFTRMPVDVNLIEQLIECLLTHNIYPMQEVAFPSYQQRTTKLANQASMIFIILYFQPSAFKQQDKKMRQLVDRFFADNWVVPLYNGESLDLFIEWNERFPSAQLALESILPASVIQSINAQNAREFKTVTNEMSLYLNQSLFTEMYIVENMDKLNDCIRNANIALRWRILHCSSNRLLPSKKKSMSASESMPPILDSEIVQLFLLVSRLESNIGDAYKRLFPNRETLWMECRKKAVSRMQQLSNHFHGDDSLTNVEKNEETGTWFETMEKEIGALVFGQSSEDVQYCIDALDDIKLLDLIDRNELVKSIIDQTIRDLKTVVKCESIDSSIGPILECISNCGYARTAMEYYVPIFHSKVMADPKSVGLLRSSFVKLATFLRTIPTETPYHVSYITETAIDFHSNALLYFVKEILDIIPVSIFSTYTLIVDSDEKSLSRLPTKIDVDKLADHSHFEDRCKLAKLTYELSILTKGIIDMEETLLGTFKMKPRHLLEEGLRRELVRQVSTAFHNTLQFPIQNDRTGKALLQNQRAFVEIFKTLTCRMEGFQRGILWLQDFLRIDCLEIYNQESARVIVHNINQELGKTRAKVLTSKSRLQVPIPRFSRSNDDRKSETFLGRSLVALVNLIDPKLTTYSRFLDGWFLQKGGKAVLEAKIMNLVRKSIGVQGIVGLETLVRHKITNELRSLYKFYDNAIGTYGVTLEKFRDQVYPEWQMPKHGHPFYSTAAKKVGKLMAPLLSYFTHIGQYQLLRRMFTTELRLSSRIDAPDLVQAVRVLNSDLMSNLDSYSIDEYTVDLMKEVSMVQQAIGGSDPMSTVFTKAHALEGLPALITLFVINYMPNVSYDHEFQALRGKEDESFDGWSIITGIGTFMKQFNTAYIKATFSLLGQYVTCSMKAHLAKFEIDGPVNSSVMSTEAMNTLVLMSQLQSICELDHTVLYDRHISDMFELMDL